MKKEMMRESIASALTKVQETGQWQEATLPEDNEDENELVMLAAHDGKMRDRPGDRAPPAVSLVGGGR